MSNFRELKEYVFSLGATRPYLVYLALAHCYYSYHVNDARCHAAPNGDHHSNVFSRECDVPNR